MNNITNFVIYNYRYLIYDNHMCLTDGQELLYLYRFWKSNNRKFKDFGSVYFNYIDAEIYLKETLKLQLKLTFKFDLDIYHIKHPDNHSNGFNGIFKISPEQFFFLKCKINDN